MINGTKPSRQRPTDFRLAARTGAHHDRRPSARWMRIWAVVGILLVASGLRAAAVHIRWSPARPSWEDRIRIAIEGASQGGVLHWGVNARDRLWEQAIPAHRPPGSSTDGLATRTPLSGPDDEGRYFVTLGPFNHPEQLVRSVDFAIQWSDGTWDNNDGADYHIAVGPQRITIAPEQPTVNDPITVTVHNSRPGGMLHWGVNDIQGQWQPPHKVYWPAGTVRFEDGQSVDTPLPPPNEAGESVMQLGPFNQAQQVVRSLHMVVHWGSDWDTDFGRNYNTTLAADTHPSAPTVTFRAPAEGAVAQVALPVTVEVERANRVELWVDGTETTTLDAEPYAFRLPTAELQPGPHVLVARVESQGRAALDERTFWIVPEYEREPLPENAGQGATVHEDGTVTFALYAPEKHFVALIGDFNDWNPNGDLMKLSPDGTWWLRRAVPPGTHRYQFLIDGVTRLADPYARDIEWKDETGAETYRPEAAKAVLEEKGEPYAWQHPDYRRPPANAMLIYEFYIEDLCPGQGFTGVVAKLDYIRDLGANAIEPLPFNEFPGDTSWGYNPSFHFAAESTYGTPRELKRLIDAAHARGLAVIMDMVLNHMDANSALFQLYGQDYDASPYFRLFLGENWGFPDLDQRSDAFKRYTRDVIAYWLQEYRIDGYRYDATRWVEWQGYNDWGASWFAYVGRQAKPDSLHIAEHLPTDPALMNNTEMDAGWHAHYRWRLREMLERAELNGAELQRILDGRRVGFQNSFQRVVYSESHDEERVLRELLKHGYDFDEALRRAETALALTLTTPGIAMIYSGQEWGEYTPRIVGPNPLQWHQLELAPFARLHERVRRLCHLRTSHPALLADNLTLFLNDEHRGVAAYRRSTGNGVVVVAVNFSRNPQDVSLPLPHGEATWRNVMADRPIEAAGDQPYRTTLEAGGCVVLQTGGPTTASHDE